MSDKKVSMADFESLLSAQLNSYRKGFNPGDRVRGTVSNIRIVKEEPRSYDLGKEARKTIAKWTFKPAMVDGKPQASRMQQEIEFAVN